MCVCARVCRSKKMSHQTVEHCPCDLWPFASLLGSSRVHKQLVFQKRNKAPQFCSNILSEGSVRYLGETWFWWMKQEAARGCWVGINKNNSGQTTSEFVNGWGLNFLIIDDHSWINKWFNVIRYMEGNHVTPYWSFFIFVKNKKPVSFLYFMAFCNKPCVFIDINFF